MKREKLEIVYSIGVLIAVPVLLVINTLVLVNTTQNAFNNELRRKADLVNSVMAESMLTNVESKDYSSIESYIKNIESKLPTIIGTQVVVEENGEPTVIAKSDTASDEIGTSSRLQITIATERNQPIAKLIDATDSRGNSSQAWNVVTPITDNDNTVVGVVSSNLLTSDAQEAISSAYRTSFIVLSISVLVILALLFRHFRLIGYVDLLAKQRELNQTMSDFLSVATHELKAPTTIIKGYLSNVMEGDHGPVSDEVKEQLQTAFQQTDRLNSLVQDLLNVSRIEQGRIEYNYSSVDTARILNVVVENYQALAKEKGLTITYTPADNVPLVRADEGRVQEIFTNLVDNAFKYTPSGSITIEQKVDKGKVITSFKDTGLGMNPDESKRLFQRFYRVKNEQTEKISGTGLGLWIIKKYIDAMGGSIEVESMVGTGSNFIVSLPITK